MKGDNMTEVNDPSLWWKQAVVYQVYPRSFKDSRGGGLGQIAGVTEKIGYLKELGVDAIWLSPFYPSQLADGGYDVDDYRNVDPKLGTMDDFDALAKAAHADGIKIVVDIVPNHSSNLHEWFKAALAAKPGSPERDRYIFRDGKGPNGDEPPTNWQNHFGGPAWTRVPDGQWYLHMFTKEQPDWNWKNEDVRADFIKTLRFWLDHGADGFRVDVAHGLAKDLDRDDLDDYVVWCTNDQPEDGSHPVIDRDEVHDIYHEWRKVFNEYDPPAFAVAEAWVRPSRQHLYASPDDLGQIFNFEFAKKDWIRDDMHLAIEEGLESAERSGSTATWVMSNHDVVRHATRYALPQVPTGEYHRLPLDWLLRDGTTYREDRALGTKRARAAIMMERWRCPAPPTCIKARNSACSKWPTFRGMSWRIRPHGAPPVPPAPKAVTAAVCRCRGLRPTLLSWTIRTMSSAMAAPSASRRQTRRPSRICRNPSGTRISRSMSNRPTRIPC